MRKWLKRLVIQAAPTCTLWKPVGQRYVFRPWPRLQVNTVVPWMKIFSEAWIHGDRR